MTLYSSYAQLELGNKEIIQVLKSTDNLQSLMESNVLNKLELNADWTVNEVFAYRIIKNEKGDR